MNCTILLLGPNPAIVVDPLVVTMTLPVTLSAIMAGLGLEKLGVRLVIVVPERLRTKLWILFTDNGILALLRNKLLSIILMTHIVPLRLLISITAELKLTPIVLRKISVCVTVIVWSQLSNDLLQWLQSERLAHKREWLQMPELKDRSLTFLSVEREI